MASSLKNYKYFSGVSQGDIGKKRNFQSALVISKGEKQKQSETPRK